MVLKINLALQGGGAHGAYSWGVLDRLLEEEDLFIDGISGTSAGAMNAAVLVDGFMKDGRTGAKKNLEDFWFEISKLGSIFSPFKQNPVEHLYEGFNLSNSWAYSWFDMLSRMFSPYELNPMNYNPLRDVLTNILDVQQMQACSIIKIFITATAVKTGHPKVFQCNEVSIDVLLASACIPSLFQAIEIDGESYWDGGYMGNPTLWPLIYNTGTEDILLVQINPLSREDTPKKAQEIANRLNEITFNSSLIAEMRAINFVSKLIKENKLDAKQYKDVKMHMITACDLMMDLDASSKLNASWDFFQHLKNIGREVTDQWLARNKKSIGQASTVNIKEVFLKK